MSALIWSIGATIVVSLLAFVGIITLSMSDKLLKKILILLVGFSAGALMGGAFLHLIPEAIEEAGIDAIFIIVLLGFAIFFIIERVLHWRHCPGRNSPTPCPRPHTPGSCGLAAARRTSHPSSPW